MTYLTWKQDTKDPHRLLGQRGNVTLYAITPFIDGQYVLDVQSPGFSGGIGIGPFAQNSVLDTNEPFDTVELAKAAAEALLGSFMLDIGARFEDAEPPRIRQLMRETANDFNARGIPRPDLSTEEGQQAMRELLGRIFAPIVAARENVSVADHLRLLENVASKYPNLVTPETRELIDELTAEAEEGYDDSQLRPRKGDTPRTAQREARRLAADHIRGQFANGWDWPESYTSVDAGLVSAELLKIADDLENSGNG